MEFDPEYFASIDFAEEYASYLLDAKPEFVADLLANLVNECAHRLVKSRAFARTVAEAAARDAAAAVPGGRVARVSEWSAVVDLPVEEFVREYGYEGEEDVGEILSTSDHEETEWTVDEAILDCISRLIRRATGGE